MRVVNARPSATQRRGVTLLEMLVAVALLILVMTILVAVFRSATGAISALRTYSELDTNLRRLNQMIREDLGNITAKVTPPNDPEQSSGYLEYAENALSDYQGEDTDDTLAFTTKAPVGRPFTGRLCIPNANFPLGYQQVTITADFAEIIYFLRNGNLYRRVLLIVGDRQLGIGVDPAGTGNMAPGGGYYTTQFDGQARLVSWQGMNDISARPSPYNPAIMNNGTLAQVVASYAPRPNTLGDLVNRHNRFAHPRFADDYVTPTGNGFTAIPDGLYDDLNGNGFPDYYPTLYPNAPNARIASDGNNPLLNETVTRPVVDYNTMGFPYVFPGAFSVGDTQPPYSLGPPAVAGRPSSVHGMGPQGSIVGNGGVPAAPPYRPNHAPLPVGDNLLTPDPTNGPFQTWWGYPTWRETMSRFWTDPIKRVNDPTSTASSTVPTPPYRSPSAVLAPNAGPALHPNDTVHSQAPGLSWTALTSLPPMNGTAYAADLQPFNDGAGSVAGPPYVFPFVSIPDNPATAYNESEAVFQDDLIMTGVRSFDIKAYDDASATYQDLGYLDLNARQLAPTAAQYRSFGHEGRMPPLTSDGVLDSYVPINPLTGRSRNIGDDDPSVIRLRRVFDTWSTDYSKVDIPPLNPALGPPFAPATYPSYPAPYPIALRGIQIQIRLADPANQHLKTLTIRQDFTKNL